jgi:PAS domain S-box-containing protein
MTVESQTRDTAIAGDQPERAPPPSHLVQLRALHQLSDAVGRAQSLADIYDHALDCLLHLLAADRAAILLLDSDGVMRFKAWRGLSDSYRRFAEGHSPWEVTDPDPQPVLVPDVSTEPSLAALRDVILGARIRALGFIPLLSRGVLLGKFMLYFDQTHAFTAEETELARTIAQYVAFAIERKLTEDALHESRDQLTVILQGVADGITVQAPNGELLYANDAAARFYGLSDGDSLQKAPMTEVVRRFDIRDETGQPVAPDQLPGRQVLRGALASEMVLRYRIRDTAEERWAIVRASPVVDEHGQVRFAINILHDYTAQKRSEERQGFLADATNVLAGSLDYETTLQHVAGLAVSRLADWCTVSLFAPDGSLRRVAAAHTDASKEPLVRELQERYPEHLARNPEAAAALAQRQSKLYTQVSPDVYERTALDEGHLRLLEALEIRSAMLVPLATGDRVLGAMSFIAAESGRRFTPDDLDLAEELARRCALAVDNALHYRSAQQAITVRDEFLSVAAHELKTPITTLSGFAQLLLRHVYRHGNVDPAKLQHGLETIHQQSQRLAQLVNQLLDVSRLDAGHLVLNRAEIDLAALVRSVVAAVQQTAEKHTLFVDGYHSLTVHLDAFRLEQVLINLLDNSIKYSPEGGEIRVSVEVAGPETPDGAADGGTWVRISVRDHGMGIPETDLTRIFDRWYQVQRDGLQSSGLGLGLYIARQIVELHGGTIAADSPADGGTRITVSLPTTPLTATVSDPPGQPVFHRGP